MKEEYPDIPHPHNTVPVFKKFTLYDETESVASDSTKLINMETQTYITCYGQIGNNGMCDKCGQPAMTTGNSCGRLIPVQPEKQQTPLQKAIARLKMQKTFRSQEVSDTLAASISYLESLLPEEKQMVIDAYNQGHIDGDSIAWCYKDQDGKQYFNETFIQ